ncbi:NADPH:quinone reductase-like protein [Sporodiniella umbellata]|nr:NADPH:quinone reductase-like protein [Sporodiniella umbellata]
MRAIVLKSPCEASDLLIGEWEKPQPTETQLLVKVKCFALNRMDLMERKGSYPGPLHSPIMGVEISGVVVSIGKFVSRFRNGDNVFGLLPQGGGYAEYAVIEEGLAMRKPDELSFQEAAAITEAWCVAYQALFLLGDIKPGNDILIHAGASAISTCIIQLAKQTGAKEIYVTVGTDEKVKFCEHLGATKGFNYNTCNWFEELEHLRNKRGVDLIIDFVGKNYWNKNVQIMAVDGQMIVLSHLSGKCTILGKEFKLFFEGPLTFLNISHFVLKRIQIKGSNIRDRTLEYQKEIINNVYRKIVLKHLVEKKSMKVCIDKVYPWEKIGDAHKQLETNQTKGKIVMEIN